MNQVREVIAFFVAAGVGGDVSMLTSLNGIGNHGEMIGWPYCTGNWQGKEIPIKHNKGP